MGRRLLLIEDDPRVRTSLRLALADEGWSVAEAETGEDGLEQLGRTSFDAVLLDVRLPGIDGFEVCRRVRRSDDIPIIMVTAKKDTHDIVAGLEAGADDYVAKPLSAQVLVARLRALLRRAGREVVPQRRVVVAGDLEIRPDAAIVLRCGEPVALTRTELRLLVELAHEPGRVMSREELLDRIWGYDYFGDQRLVDVHIGRLRAKIEDDPSNPQHVVTVRGLGYRFGS